MTEPKSGPSRRTVLKGAAWSVPVVAAATAVPMASASLPAPGNLGPLYASSVDITTQTINIGALQFDCAAGMTGADIITNVFQEITITSTNPAPYDLTNVIVQGAGWTVLPSSTADRLVLQHGPSDLTCEGFVQGPSLFFNNQTAAPMSLTVSAIAYNDSYTMSPLMIQPETGTGTLVGPPA